MKRMPNFAEWSTEVGLGRHAETFRADDIDLHVLRPLTEAEFKDLGLSLGDRKLGVALISGRFFGTSGQG